MAFTRSYADKLWTVRIRSKSVRVSVEWWSNGSSYVDFEAISIPEFWDLKFYRYSMDVRFFVEKRLWFLRIWDLRNGRNDWVWIIFICVEANFIVYWFIISIISFIFFHTLFFSIFDLFTQSGYSLAISIYLISSIINNFDIVYLHSLEQQSYFTHIYVFSIYLTTFYYPFTILYPEESWCIFSKSIFHLKNLKQQ